MNVRVSLTFKALPPWALYLRSSSTKVFIFGCSLVKAFVKSWRFIFLMSLAQYPTWGPAKMKDFCPAWLYASFWQCSQILKKQKPNKTNIQTHRHRHTWTHTDTHTPVSIKTYFYSLQYHFSFPAVGYPWSIQWKSLKTQNIFSIPLTLNHSKKEIPCFASFK